MKTNKTIKVSTLAGIPAYLLPPAAPVGHELGRMSRVLFVEVRPHHSAPSPTALTESTGEDPVQACCSRVQVSAWDSTVLSRRWARVGLYGWFRGPKTPSICFLTIAECPSYTAVYRRRSGLLCCCSPYMEQSAPAHHVRTLCVCFPRSPQGFLLQTFFPVTNCNFCSACAVTVVVFGHFHRSFLLTYREQDDKQNANEWWWWLVPCWTVDCSILLWTYSIHVSLGRPRGW